MPWPSAADEASGSADLYCFGPGLTVSIRGERRPRAYFRAEYASAARRASPEVPGRGGGHRCPCPWGGRRDHR